MGLHECVEHRTLRLADRMSGEIAKIVVILPVEFNVAPFCGQRDPQKRFKRAAAAIQHGIKRIERAGKFRRDGQHTVAAAAAAPDRTAGPPAAKRHAVRLEDPEKFRPPRAQFQRVSRACIHPDRIFKRAQIIIMVCLSCTFKHAERFNSGSRHR